MIALSRLYTLTRGVNQHVVTCMIVRVFMSCGRIMKVYRFYMLPIVDVFVHVAYACLSTCGMWTACVCVITASVQLVFIWI